jgi:hypothetical protein
MSLKIDFASRLTEALHKANNIYSKENGTVTVSNKKIEPKKPIFLELTYDNGETRKIGVIHLVHLKGDDWEDTPAETLAKTADEISQAILARIKLFFEAEKKGFYIDEHGTIFDFRDVNVEIHEDNTFSINKKIVSLPDKKLHLTWLISEGIITFKKTISGETELSDELDQRPKNGAFIDKDGNFHRK